MSESLDFIRQIVHDDVAAGRNGGRVLTRFPPEPNGYLHVGHAAAICLDFGIAEEFGGETHLRMDDTNPTTEDPRFVEAIERDIRWLGFEWAGPTRYASDYFEALYRLAIRMIEDGFAYVDSLSEAEIRDYRGTVTEPGRPSPYRERSVEENLDLFGRMRAGEFADGEHVLRARIDMGAANMKMRDPLMYRIRHAHHYRTGDAWPIYPMYDWAHGQSDAIEGVTHSLCTLEFENNRELYDWFIEHTRPAAAGIEKIPGARGGGGEELGSWDPRPRQYEFARFNLDYTVMSKRRLLRLVEEGHVEGWDDPRMPTLAGLRRRGVPPVAIRRLMDQVGIARAEKRVDIGKLEYAVRDALNPVAPRVLCVLRPLRVVIENLPEDRVEWLEAPHFPRDVETPPAEWPATRRIPFTRTILIEREDFAEDPPRGFRRLAPGREVRLRHGYFIRCCEVIRGEDGEIVELRCTYDPETRGGASPDGRAVSGTLHWVSADRSLPAEVRLYDRLFRTADPDDGVEDFIENLNPRSLEVLREARIEPAVADHPEGTAYQFERLGYFVRDRRDGEAGPADTLVFNRTVTLRDTWAGRVRRESGGRAATSPERDARAEVSEESPVEEGPDRKRREREAARAADAELRSFYERFRDDLGLPEPLADQLTGDVSEARFFDRAGGGGELAGAVARWMVHEVRGALSGPLAETRLTPEALGHLVELVETGIVSRTVGKELLARLLVGGGDPREIAESEGLSRVCDREEIARVVADVLASHPAELERFREGQAGLVGFFVGQVMRRTEGRADPRIVREVLDEELSAAG